MSPVALLLALASLSPTPETAPATPLGEASPQSAPGTPGTAPDGAYDLGTLETVTTARRGAALGDYEPELTLDEEQIKAYGASTIQELMALLEPVTRSSRGGSPVFLVNGRRISGFREIRGIPPEAIERTEVLPEETALAYGYSADQRVVNFVLKADFRSLTMQASLRRPDQGGRTSTQLENNVLRIAGKERWTLDLGYQNDTPLFETERHIVRTATGAPYDLLGNVTAPTKGQEIDPALSALLGQTVTTASVGAGAAGGATLADFGVGPRTDDLTAYRTLLPKRENASLNGSMVRDLNRTMSLTLSGGLEDTSSLSYLGLPGISLTLPSTSPYSPFGGDVLVNRFIDAPGAMTRNTDTRTGNASFLVDGYLGDWRWTVNGGYDRTETKTRTGRGVDPATLQAGVTAGTIDPFGDLGQLPFNPFDTAKSVSSKSSLEGVINGEAWDGPAGSLTSTFKIGFDSQSLDSETLRSGDFSERSLSRDRASASGNFNLPIASRDREVLGVLGDLSANLNLAYEDLSDFGGLSAYTVGLNWSPWEPLNFTASWADEQKAPSMSQLNDPTISTPNVPVFDFAKSQSVNITRIDGGNPNLSEETKRVLKLGVNLTPLKDKDLRFTANYTRTETEGSIAAFPTITPELEAALPERFTRDLDGNLLSIDARPLNFQMAEQQEIRWGLNFSTAFGKPDPAAMARINARGGGGPRGPGAPQGGPGAGGRPGGAGAPGGGSPAVMRIEGGPPPGGGAGGPPPGGGIRMQVGGPGGPGGRGRGGGMLPGQGRFNVSLYHTYRIQDEITIRNGLPVLDLLDGAAIGARGGQPRNEVQFQMGVFKSGMGGFLNANWKESTRINGGANPSDDLTFSDLTTVNLNLFADLSSRQSLVSRYPWLKGARVSVGVENLFDQRLDVRDGLGNAPLSYQPDYLDPLGRTFRISLRKILY
ncbi:TonB-dependent receptor [Brevundimonas naejangsanensis]|uniref:TonB-dependent receptor n=1 Tax=Brevundimonas naejangsanensis TaxID=588932 RepID=A0A494RIR6_9CAUL|nr:TonB-dependent receptor [Brevundimonas naejangsanensis]AYG93864.1 TonB-dependent receptor [Brevundimonas naejangsanensis]